MNIAAAVIVAFLTPQGAPEPIVVRSPASDLQTLIGVRADAGADRIPHAVTTCNQGVAIVSLRADWRITSEPSQLAVLVHEREHVRQCYEGARLSEPPAYAAQDAYLREHGERLTDYISPRKLSQLTGADPLAAFR